MKPKRRYLEFSLGTMFAAVTVLCIWLGVQVKWIRDRSDAREWLKRHDCVVWGDEWHVAGKRWIVRNAPWTIRIMGEPGVCMVMLNETTLSSDELKFAEQR